MDSRHQYDELLTRYLANGLNGEEEEMVQKWLSDDPENQRYFNDLIKAWRLADAKYTIDYVLNEIEPDDKWQQFRLSVIQKTALPETAEDIVPADDNGIVAEAPVRRLSWQTRLMRIAVAAAVVVAIVMIGRILQTEKKPAIIVENKGKADTILPVVQNIDNTSGKEKEITLPDGSLVILADKSSSHLPACDSERVFTVFCNTKERLTIQHYIS